MAETAKAEVVDGRRLRSERSKKALMDAGLALVADGNLAPTAQQISERAGVGIRSFFRHFEDMEAFFTALDAEINTHYTSLFAGGDREGTLEERIEHAVERHADAYEQLMNIILATRTMLWRYEVVRKNYEKAQRGLRKDLNEWLPELNELSKEDREAVDAIASFEMWHRLRSSQSLGKKASVDIIKGLLKALIMPS